MLKKRTQEQRYLETREALLSAGSQIVLDEGIQALRIADIADRAGVTTGAVQHHFGGIVGFKVNLLDYMFDKLSKGAVRVERSGDLDQRMARLRYLLVLPGTEAMFRVLADIYCGCRHQVDLHDVLFRHAREHQDVYDQWWLRFTEDVPGTPQSKLLIGRSLRVALYGCSLEASYHARPSAYFASIVGGILNMATVALRDLAEKDTSARVHTKRSKRTTPALVRRPKGQQE